MKAPTLALLLSLATLWCCSCATTQPSTAGLTKDQIALEKAKLDDAREVRNQRWARVGETAGTLAISLAGSWFKAWLSKDEGLSKDR